MEVIFVLNLHEGPEYISNYIRTYYCWEPITTEIVLELLKDATPNTIFVDIGANIGYFSMLAASKNFHVVAFEPVEANLSLLKKSIADNNFDKLILTHKTLISDKKEEVIVNVSKHNMGLCSTRLLLDSDFCYSETHMTDILDTYFGINTINNLIIKIDVEETEKNVLYGMEDTMKSGKVSHIIIEVARYDKDIFDFFRKHGYNRCVDIGYDDREYYEHTEYLKQDKYIWDIDDFELYYQERPNIMVMCLFYR